MQISSQTFCSLPHPYSSPKGRVLIVDDGESVTVLLQRSLARLGPGMEVWTANSGAQALDLLNSERLDLLITDYQMPNINGLELTEAVRQHHTEVKVILMTAYPSPQIADLVDRLAVDCYLIKPFSCRELREIVRHLLISPAPLSPPPGGDSHDDRKNRNSYR